MTSSPSAERLGRFAQERGLTVAVAESLTGGTLAAELARASDAGVWFRGAVVAYASAVKHDLLDVPPGPVVSEAAASAMARGVAARLGADIGLAVTGVGGPDEQDGIPPGTVWSAVWTAERHDARLHHFDGEPAEVCDDTCETAIAQAIELIDGGR